MLDSIQDKKFLKKDNIEALRILTPLITSLPEMPATVSESTGFKEHQMTCGTSFSWDILDREELSCAHWYNSQGSAFPQHAHKGREWLIIFKGSILITIEDQKEERLVVGQYKIIEPNVLHSARFLEDCHYLAILIPKSKNWPTLS